MKKKPDKGDVVEREHQKTISVSPDTYEQLLALKEEMAERLGVRLSFNDYFRRDIKERREGAR